MSLRTNRRDGQKTWNSPQDRWFNPGRPGHYAYNQLFAALYHVWPNAPVGTRVLVPKPLQLSAAAWQRRLYRTFTMMDYVLKDGDFPTPYTAGLHLHILNDAVYVSREPWQTPRFWPIAEANGFTTAPAKSE